MFLLCVETFCRRPPAHIMRCRVQPIGFDLFEMQGLIVRLCFSRALLSANRKLYITLWNSDLNNIYLSVDPLHGHLSFAFVALYPQLTVAVLVSDK